MQWAAEQSSGQQSTAEPAEQSSAVCVVVGGIRAEQQSAELCCGCHGWLAIWDVSLYVCDGPGTASQRL